VEGKDTGSKRRPPTMKLYTDGDCDVDVKIPAYQRRGDLEIWRIHPYDCTLTAWRRSPDGNYEETTFREGSVNPVALPDVIVELAALFDR
jgi:hypothetical protein